MDEDKAIEWAASKEYVSLVKFRYQPGLPLESSSFQSYPQFLLTGITSLINSIDRIMKDAIRNNNAPIINVLINHNEHILDNNSTRTSSGRALISEAILSRSIPSLRYLLDKFQGMSEISINEILLLAIRQGDNIEIFNEIFEWEMRINYDRRGRTSYDLPSKRIMSFFPRRPKIAQYILSKFAESKIDYDDCGDYFLENGDIVIIKRMMNEKMTRSISEIRMIFTISNAQFDIVQYIAENFLSVVKPEVKKILDLGFDKHGRWNNVKLLKETESFIRIPMSFVASLIINDKLLVFEDVLEARQLFMTFGRKSETVKDFPYNLNLESDLNDLVDFYQRWFEHDWVIRGIFNDFQKLVTDIINPHIIKMKGGIFKELSEKYHPHLSKELVSYLYK